jgi:hypothetical protein
MQWLLRGVAGFDWRWLTAKMCELSNVLTQEPVEGHAQIPRNPPGSDRAA